MALLGPGVNKIQDSNLKKTFAEFANWIQKVETLRAIWTENRHDRFENQLIEDFNEWINSQLEERARLVARERDVGEDFLLNLFDPWQKLFIGKFTQQTTRAFASSKLQILDSIGLKPAGRFQFGFRKLFSILRRRKFVDQEADAGKLAEEQEIAGISRLATSKTGRQRIFKINLASYMELLIITSQSDWLRRWEEVVALQLGKDLVRIDNHPPKNPFIGKRRRRLEVCERWRGKVVSLTGATPGVPTLEDAIQDGMFHPRCTHGYKFLE